MAEVVGRSKLFAPHGSNTRLPVAHMVCNQSPPIGEISEGTCGQSCAGRVQPCAVWDTVSRWKIYGN